MDDQMERRTPEQQNPAGQIKAESVPEVYPAAIDEPGIDHLTDAEPRPPRSGKSAKKRRRDRRQQQKKRQQRMLIILACCIGALLIGITAFVLVTKQQERQAQIAAQLQAEEELRRQQQLEKEEYERLANSTTFLKNISVNGVDIGGMTMDEAKLALSAADQQVRTLGEQQLTYGDKLYSIDLNTLVTETNLDAVLSEAFNLARTGSYADMKTTVEEVEKNGRSYTLEVTGFDRLTLATRVAEIALLVDAEAQNASIAEVDKENRTIVFADEVKGVSVEQAALVEQIVTAVNAHDSTPIAIPTLETNPVVTRAQLEAGYKLRGSATTNFSSSTSSRKYNIRKGAGLINGTILKPGDVFSTNDALGTRTTGNGWKMAGAYENGATVEQAGGGVCQLSTTLYNAVAKGDLEIVSRRNHSMKVSYIDMGLDATINSVGNIIDFKFKNNTASDVIIFAYTTNNKTVTFEIWGPPFATDAYDEIKLTSEKVSETKPDSEPVEIPKEQGTLKPDGTELQPGERYTAVAARTGYVYQSFKNYYKAGSLVKTEKFATSTYKSYNGEIWLGPDPLDVGGGVVNPTPTMDPALSGQFIVGYDANGNPVYGY